MTVLVLQELGLPEDPNIPMLGFIGRLDYQKGVDLIKDSYEWIMGEGVQLVMLGSGRGDLEDSLRYTAGDHSALHCVARFISRLVKACNARGNAPRSCQVTSIPPAHIGAALKHSLVAGMTTSFSVWSVSAK